MSKQPRPKQQQAKTLFIAAAVVLMSAGTLYFSRFVSQSPVNLRGRAGTSGKEATVFLFPKEIKSNIGQKFVLTPKIVGPEDKRIASVLISYQFDKNYLQFQRTGYTATDDSHNLVSLKQTTSDEANQTGQVNMFLAVTDKEKAPRGVANLPQLNFAVLDKGVSFINVDSLKTQVVFATGEQAQVKIDGSVNIDSREEVVDIPTVLPTEIIISPAIIPSVTLVPSIAEEISTSSSNEPTVSSGVIQ